jgi:hypothetical protein
MGVSMTNLRVASPFLEEDRQHRTINPMLSRYLIRRKVDLLILKGRYRPTIHICLDGHKGRRR